MRIPNTGSKPPPDTNVYYGPAVHKIDHAEAWNVAHYRGKESNLARAYIELRELAAKMEQHTTHLSSGEAHRLHLIVHANDI